MPEMLEPGPQRWQELTRTLRGERVSLEPLRADHGDELWEAAQAPEICAWLEHFAVSRERFEGWLETALAASAVGEEGAFAIRRVGDGRLVGSSRYLAIRAPNRGLEIGWTWFNPSVWRTGVNTETKLLLLSHAFETLGCIRVELKTDARNERSRAAISSLPARFEGIFRKHMIVPDIGLRDTAYFSITDDEWPDVRAALRARLCDRTP